MDKQKDNQSHAVAMYLLLGVVAVFAVFVLMAFARSVIYRAVDTTESRYDVETNPQLGTDHLDALVVTVPSVSATDPVRSSNPTQNYRLTIIEYGDFVCPFCAEMSDHLSRILSVYPEVRLVWKDFPHPLHFDAEPAARAARCAQEQDAFWEYHDALFANQDILNNETYRLIAATMGLDMSAFDICVRNNTYQPLIDANSAEAQAYDVVGTPYLFVGDTVVDQLLSYEQLESVVQSELE